MRVSTDLAPVLNVSWYKSQLVTAAPAQPNVDLDHGAWSMPHDADQCPVTTLTPTRMQSFAFEAYAHVSRTEPALVRERPDNDVDADFDPSKGLRRDLSALLYRVNQAKSCL